MSSLRTFGEQAREGKDTALRLEPKSLTWNAAANLVGRSWSALLSLIAVPILLGLLGAEAYGLIGLFATLEVAFSFLDLGLSATVNREIARSAVAGQSPLYSKVLLRTFEIIYWGIGLCIGALIFAASGWIATNWVNVVHLSHAEVQLAVMIMAISFAARWPVSLYTGVLRGQQRQVLQNIIFIAVQSLRTLGALAVVTWVSQTVIAFLLWQILANVLEVAVCAAFAWSGLRRQVRGPARFDRRVLGDVWRFALSFNAVGVLGLLLSQADKLVISRALPLEQLGYYAVAATAAGLLYLISYSVSTAVFPRFSAYWASRSKSLISLEYHGSLQVIAFFGVAAGLAMSLFAFDILLLWTGSLEVAQYTYVVLSLLAIAGLVNAILNPAYSLLVAAGYTQVPLVVNIASVLVFIPALWLLVPMIGIQVAALLWLAQNMVSLVVYAIYVHKLVLDQSAIRSLARDVMPYLVIGCFWFGGMRLLLPSSVTALTTGLFLAVAAIGYFASILLLSRYLDLSLSDFLKDSSSTLVSPQTQ
jgi:O-antigen/teichoic acid export membrane protein